MNPLNLDDVRQYVKDNIGTFHAKRIASLDNLKLKDVLRRKNPYLYKAKHMLTADAIVGQILDAHISSSEEGIFGDWLEGLAIFINSKVFGGIKSSTPGIDLEFTRDNIRYLVNIKSGPNWGNKSQIEKMLEDFASARRTLATSGSNAAATFVNGCCYGRDKKPYKVPKKGTDYYKYCGQDFWEFISGDNDLYTEIIEPLGYLAKERNDEFQLSYAKAKNSFVAEFIADFCFADGSIDWEKIVKLNSESTILNKKP